MEEIIGNIIENEGKWGRKWINIRIEEVEGEKRKFEIVIEEDGKGIEEEKIEEEIKRGRRVDEKKKGKGMGIEIVKDKVREYGGSMNIGKDEIGGLDVRVVLKLKKDWRLYLEERGLEGKKNVEWWECMSDDCYEGRFVMMIV